MPDELLVVTAHGLSNKARTIQDANKQKPTWKLIKDKSEQTNSCYRSDNNKKNIPIIMELQQRRSSSSKAFKTTGLGGGNGNGNGIVTTTEEFLDEQFEPLQYDVTNCFTMLFGGRTTLYLDEDTVSIQDNCLCNSSSTEVRKPGKKHDNKKMVLLLDTSCWCYRVSLTFRSNLFCAFIFLLPPFPGSRLSFFLFERYHMVKLVMSIN